MDAFCGLYCVLFFIKQLVTVVCVKTISQIIKQDISSHYKMSHEDSPIVKLPANIWKPVSTVWQSFLNADISSYENYDNYCLFIGWVGFLTA